MRPAYVLMTNQVYILITTYTENGISKVMQMVGRYYVQYFNYTYERTGTFWEGRFNATLIDSETYALTCYIVILSLIQYVHKIWPNIPVNIPELAIKIMR